MWDSRSIDTDYDRVETQNGSRDCELRFGGSKDVDEVDGKAQPYRNHSTGRAVVWDVKGVCCCTKSGSILRALRVLSGLHGAEYGESRATGQDADPEDIEKHRLDKSCSWQSGKGEEGHQADKITQRRESLRNGGVLESRND